MEEPRKRLRPGEMDRAVLAVLDGSPNGTFSSDQLASRLGICRAYVSQILGRTNSRHRVRRKNGVTRVDENKPIRVTLHLTSEVYGWLRQNTPHGSTTDEVVRSIVNDAWAEETGA